MSAAIKVKRFQALESDFTKNGRNRTEVRVPASVGFSDLTGSKVILDMNVQVKQGATTVPLPVTFGNHEMVGGAQALIRNSRVVSEQNGLLNERRYANVIDANLEWYGKSRAKEDAESAFGWSNTQAYGIDRASQLPDCPFIIYSRPSFDQPSTTTQAYTRRAEIPVAWKHIDAFGVMPQFPHVNVGNLNYHIEFEDQIDVVAPAQMPSRALVPCVSTAAVANKLKTLTLVPTASALWRVPQVGDLVTAYFLNSTAGTAFAPKFTAGVAVAEVDQIATVSLVSGVYTVTLADGFNTAGATDACVKILLAYWSPAENDALVSTGLPLPIANNTAGAVAGGSAAPIVFAVNTPGGLQATLNDAGVLTGTADAFKSCPWYVGAPVTLCGIDGNNDTPVRVETFITNLTVNTTTYALSIELQDTITLSGATGLRVPCLTYRDSKMTGDVFTGTAVKFTCEWNVDELYLEILQLQLTPSMMEKAMASMANAELPFYDQVLVQKNMPATTLHTEVLSLPANCVGVSVLTPQNLSLVSGFDNCESYRIALNGKEVTNQNIYVGSAQTVGRQIHNVLLREHLINIGRALNKFDAPKFCYDIDVVGATHAMFPCIVPMVPAETIYQIQLFGGSMSSKNLFFVFHVMKTLKLGGAGKAQVL